MKNRFKQLKDKLKPATDYIKPYTQPLAKYITEENSIRALNGLTAILIFNEWIKNKDNLAASEYFFDIAVHLLQASLSQSSSAALQTTAVILNTMRLTNVYHNLNNNVSTIPLAANIADVAFHSANLRFNAQSLIARQQSAKDRYEPALAPSESKISGFKIA